VNIRKATTATPGAKRTKVLKTASSLTCELCDDLASKPKCDFSYTDISKIPQHTPKGVVIAQLKGLLKAKVTNLQDIEAEILACQAQVAKRCFVTCLKFRP